MFFMIVFAVLVADQVSKFFIQSNMVELQSVPIIPNIFHITYVLNPGAAFSLFAHRTTFFIIVTIVAVILSVYFYYKFGRKEFILGLGIALQCGGAVGNLIDRLRIGKVVDFLDFRVWPVFNIADSFICIGVALICWQLLKPEKKSPHLRVEEKQ
ncbi:MAG: signal peptidase II [Clostridia bacterium]|nr:signal peptidase II [Clostridia bacterium]